MRRSTILNLPPQLVFPGIYIYVCVCVLKRWYSQGSLTKGRRLNTVDLLVLTSFEQLIFIVKILLSDFYKTSYLN
jgi:hypothetical protein